MPVFTIREAADAKEAWNFIKENAAEQARIKQPLMVTVEAYQEKRTLEQNKRLHALLEEISEHAWAGKKQYPMEFWKEYFRRLFLLKDEYTTPDGEIIQVYWSTADLKVKDFAKFLTKVEVHAVQTLGVELIEV
ncbi:recombination protein NinB [Paraburkholderia sp. BL9I2N2]|uniref:recombination protein NinB n=1 Tax=Paraburkholderia sp. BL9I2N2 TaxID=1938809 RepID=UPI00104975F5|nr:recombination protein NinB [Paraburkholderia sp. BL9I2N2]TCK87320.1 NinB protein [Paraburkholderia sp. BL9I2N2]